MIGVRHGSTTGYRKGCRCRECMAANRAYVQEYRTALRRRAAHAPVARGGWDTEDVRRLPPGWLDGPGRARYDHRCPECGLCWMGPSLKNCPRCLESMTKSVRQPKAA